MKLNFGKKLALTLHWLLSVLICAFAAITRISPTLIDDAVNLLNTKLGANLAMAAGIAVLAIYVLLAALTICIIFGGRGKKSERGFITVDSSDAGRTRIAIGAVEQMIRQAVRGVDGITDMKSSIENNSDSISIACSVAIANGAHVPTVTMNIQRAIRGYIELNCGVAVREVSVSVHSLDDGEGKGRRRGFKPAAAPVAPACIPVPETVKETAAEEAPAPEAEPQAEAAVCEEAESVLPETAAIELTLDAPEETEDMQETPEAE